MFIKIFFILCIFVSYLFSQDSTYVIKWDTLGCEFVLFITGNEYSGNIDIRDSLTSYGNWDQYALDIDTCFGEVDTVISIAPLTLIESRGIEEFNIMYIDSVDTIYSNNILAAFFVRGENCIRIFGVPFEINIKR